MQIPCQLYDLPDIFSYSVGCLFTFLMVSFEAEKFLILMKFSVLFYFVVCTFGFISKKALPNPKS